MAILRNYFDTDFKQLLNASSTMLFNSPQGEKVEVLARVHYDFDSNTKFLSFFIPIAENPFDLLVNVINNIENALAITDGVEIQSGLQGEKPIDSKHLQFSGKIFAYCDSTIPEDKLETLQSELLLKKLFIQYRGPSFASQRSELEKPLAFISHDSRDKELVARPIAIGLSKLMCPVWFDEYSLKVGDKLRESIEKGIKDCKKCILILSPHFLANNGWTKVEFNSIFTRELIEETDVVLPVWHGINREELYEYCPSLVNKLGIKTDVGIEEVIRKLHKAIQ